MKFLEGKSLRAARKFFVAIIGFTLLIVGAAMIVLPGPALIVIPLGLAVLATEFLWARRVLQKLKNVLKEGREKFTGERAVSPEGRRDDEEDDEEPDQWGIKGPRGDSRQDPANGPSHQAKKFDLRGSPPIRNSLRRAPKTRRHRERSTSMNREAFQGAWKIGTIIEIPVR